jgi:hypothetical protein
VPFRSKRHPISFASLQPEGFVKKVQPITLIGEAGTGEFRMSAILLYRVEAKK